MKKVMYLWAIKAQGRIQRTDSAIGWALYATRAAAKLQAAEGDEVVRVKVTMQEGAP